MEDSPFPYSRIDRYILADPNLKRFLELNSIFDRFDFHGHHIPTIDRPPPIGFHSMRAWSSYSCDYLVVTLSLFSCTVRIVGRSHIE